MKDLLLRTEIERGRHTHKAMTKTGYEKRRRIIQTYLECLIRGETGRVGNARTVAAVVVRLVASQVPAPGLVVVPDERLVAHGVEGRRVCSQAHHGVGPTLLHGPRQFKHVKTRLVPNLEKETVLRSPLNGGGAAPVVGPPRRSFFKNNSHQHMY